MFTFVKFLKKFSGISAKNFMKLWINFLKFYQKLEIILRRLSRGCEGKLPRICKNIFKNFNKFFFRFTHKKTLEDGNFSVLELDHSDS